MNKYDFAKEWKYLQHCTNFLYNDVNVMTNRILPCHPSIISLMTCYAIMVQIAYGYVTITPLMLTFLLNETTGSCLASCYCGSDEMGRTKHNICFVKRKTCGSA